MSDLNVALRVEIKNVTDYITRRYGAGTNRNCWGIAHRRWLLDSGRYIKTTERDQELIDKAMEVTRKVYAKWVGEAGPELIHFRPHHKGTAIGMDDEHWPGCGCA